VLIERALHMETRRDRRARFNDKTFNFSLMHSKQHNKLFVIE
jgi:hypothetical protein